MISSYTTRAAAAAAAASLLAHILWRPAAAPHCRPPSTDVDVDDYFLFRSARRCRRRGGGRVGGAIFPLGLCSWSSQFGAASVRAKGMGRSFLDNDGDDR